MKRQHSTHSLISKERRLIHYEERIPGFALTIGKVNQTKAYDPIEEHSHDDCFEIVYIVKGKQVYSIGACMYQIGSGQCFITLPNEQHSSGGHPEDKSMLYYMIFSRELLRQIGFDDQEVQHLEEYLMTPKRRIFQGTKEMLPILEALVTLPESEPILYKTRVRQYVTQYLLQVVEHMGNQPYLEATPLEEVLRYIALHIKERITIRELALLMNLSESRFKTYFRSVIGIPPGEYILRQKVDMAKQLLEENTCTVTEIAYTLSFSSSQYFATVFKRFTTFSPAQYRMICKGQ